MKRSAVPIILLLLALPCFADSTNTFALQGLNRVFLTPNSTPLLGASGSNSWDTLIFVTLIGNGNYTISYTLDIGNIHLTSSQSGPCINCAYSQTYILPGFATPTHGTLTVNLNGVSQTYSFLFSAVPEPTSLALFGTGLAGVLWRRYRERIH